jgi:hypothetical protein
MGNLDGWLMRIKASHHDFSLGSSTIRLTTGAYELKNIGTGSSSSPEYYKNVTLDAIGENFTTALCIEFIDFDCYILNL